jgi:hypothetical protein
VLDNSLVVEAVELVDSEELLVLVVLTELATEFDVVASVVSVLEDDDAVPVLDSDVANDDGEVVVVS